MFIDPATDYHGNTHNLPKPVKGWYTMKNGKPVTAPAAPKPGRYAKPKPAAGLPKWFLDIRAGSDFMPAKVKPYSYNYMALVESPNRQGLYTAGGTSPTNASGMNLNLQFNTPTDDVAQGIKTNYNLTRDEQNLGLEPAPRKESFLQRAMDVISRPLYMIANQHKVNTEQHYMTPDSAGGTKVTTSEHIQGWLQDVLNLTPFGAVKNLATGQMDDHAAAAWAGLSGKAKTTTSTILEEEYPGFAQAHPKLAVGASIIGDFALDPINWVSFGMTGPGTVTKSVAAAGLKAAGRKELAKKLLEETLLTKTGRNAAKDVLKNDIRQADVRKLGRAENKLNKLAKKAGENKQVITQAKYKLAASVVAQHAAEAAIADISGAKFALRTLKRGLPTAGIGTLSRANLAASHWRKVETAKTAVEMAQAHFVNSFIDSTKDKQHWNGIYAGMKDPDTGKIADFTYRSGNRLYTVKFSQAKGFHDFLSMVFHEGAAIAKLQEGNVKAARGRSARIGATEARSRDFAAAFSKKIQSDLGNALDPDVGRDFDKLRTRANSVNTFNDATPAHLENKQYARVKEDDLDNMTYEQMHDLAKKTWKENKPAVGGKRWSSEEPHILVHRGDGKIKKVNLRVLKAHAEAAERERVADMLARAAVDMRTAAQKAQDASEGITDPIARARERMVEAYKNVVIAKARKTADLMEELKQGAVGASNKTAAAKNIFNELKNLAPQEVKDLYEKISHVLTSDKYTDKEKRAFNAILNDHSLTMEEQITKLLTHMSVSDEEVGNIVSEIAQFSLKDGVLSASATGTGSGPEMIKRIMNEVLKDRVTSRIGKINAKTANEAGPLLKASGHRIITDEAGNVQVVRADKTYGTLGEQATFQRDLHGEIGMAVLDASRYAIDYAVQTEMFKDPKVLFDTIRESVDGFINDELAGLKRDVFQLIYNINGVRLPEDLVPKIEQINNVFPVEGPSSYKWVKENGDLANQEVPWRNLSRDMENWAVEVFKKNMGLEGTNDEIIAQAKAAAETKLTRNPNILERMRHWVDQTKVLSDTARVSPRTINDTTEVVNHYTPLDFLIHGDQILKSQDMTLKVVSKEAGKVNRINSGRLSALDSFAYVDDGVRKGLEALGEIKKLFHHEDPEVASAAKQVWAKLFKEAGGFEYVDKVKSQQLGDAFSSLGIHARLKEDVVSKGPGSLGTKQRADLMEHLWGMPSLHHELQKAMQQKILDMTMVDGKLPAQAAEEIAQDVEKFFDGYENIKRRLHPQTEDFNVPGASRTGRVNIVKPKAVFEGPPTGAAKSALSGTTQEQRARVAELMNQLKEVEKARQGEREALSKYAQAYNNPESLGVTVPAEEAALENAHKVYVKHLEGTATPKDDADFVNISNDPADYTPAEIERLRAWIGKTYATHPPERLAKDMHALSTAITHDIQVAQGQIISYMKDYGLKHSAAFKLFGIPLMNTPHGMNMTHTEAGVTALAQSQSRARRALTRAMNPLMTTGKQRELAINLQRRSHVLNKALDNISNSYANAASIARQVIIPALNGLYKTINKGEYLDPAVGALGRKARFRKINHQLFDPAVQHTGDPLKMFDQVETYADGTPYNPVKEIETGFQEISTRYFGEKAALKNAEMIQMKLHAFNAYIVNKYRLKDFEVDNIYRAMKRGEKIAELSPYTPEWLREATKYLGVDSRLSQERLLNMNLGEFHYALHDTKLKLEAGDALHNGVWDEFASEMPYDQAKMWNDGVQTQTIGANGEPMRGKLIDIQDIPGSGHGIDIKYIPAKFRDGNHYISEDMLPDISLLFNYMDNSHKLNDTINAGLFDKIMGYFKASVTVYNIPTYPIRNLMSDVFLGAMDGLVNPRYYGDAAKILYSHRQDMKDMKIEDYEKILDKNFLTREVAAAQHDPDSVMDPLRNPNKPTVLRLVTSDGNTIELNNDQIMHLYNQLGLGQNRVSGDIPEATAAARRGAVFAGTGKVTDAMRTLNDIREDWGRLSHFLYALENEAALGGGLDQIARRAGDRVIKYHFDYSDVSLWEKKYVAKYIPFYKWTRNIIPFTLSNMVLNPKFLNLEKAANAAVGNLLNDDPNNDKEDFIVADWIKNDLPVPIGMWTDPNGYQFQQFASMYLPLSSTLTGTFAPTLDPIGDALGGRTSVGTGLMDSVAGAGTTALGMTNPVIKSLYEMASHQKLVPGASVPEGADSWLTALEAAIPGQPMFSNLSKSGQSYFKDGTEGKNQAAQVLKMLGALQLYNNNESAQKGQNKITEDAKRANINAKKAELAKQLKINFPNMTDANAKTVIDDFVMKNLRSNDAARL